MTAHRLGSRTPGIERPRRQSQVGGRPSGCFLVVSLHVWPVWAGGHGWAPTSVCRWCKALYSFFISDSRSSNRETGKHDSCLSTTQPDSHNSICCRLTDWRVEGSRTSLAQTTAAPEAQRLLSAGENALGLLESRF